MSASTDQSPLVLLIHGAWHGAWCWAPLQAQLDERGIASMAIDLPGHGASLLPLGDLHGDAAHVADVVSALDRRVILVGHSYGGAVITEAAVASEWVAHLVYLTAFALDTGESVLSLLGSLPLAPVGLSAAMVPRDDGTIVLQPDLCPEALYGKCSPGAVAAAIARLCPQPAATFTQKVTGSPRDTIGSTYVCCELDDAISITHQRAMAARCDTVVSLATDHSPFTSMPDATADILAGVLAGVLAEVNAGTSAVDHQ